jgi:hypothetical protein
MRHDLEVSLMRKLVVATALAAGVILGAAGTVDAGPGGGNSCAALNEAHITIIDAQGLDRHLTLGVHTQAFVKLLAQCA